MCAQNAEKLPTDDTLSPSEFINSTAELVDSRSDLQGYRLTWGATPLNPNPNQYVVYKSLSRRISDSAPESTPDDVKKFVLQHFMSRFYQRQDRNSKSFIDRRPIVIENLNQTIHEILCAAINGTSKPDDLLILRRGLEMPSIELARLTHPYGTHMETLEEMRQAVDFAIENNGGALINDDSMTTYGVDGGHIRDKGENIEIGFLMKRKRVRGIMPDDTVVIERSTFVLRVDRESRLDQDIARKFRDIKIDKNPDWQKQVMEIITAYDLMPVLLSNNEFDIAIPLSTTTYAYNKERVDELEAAEKERRIPKGTAEERFDRARAKIKSEAIQRALNSNYLNIPVHSEFDD